MSLLSFLSFVSFVIFVLFVGFCYYFSDNIMYSFNKYIIPIIGVLLQAASSLQSDVCDFSRIYNESFNYCVPQEVVKSFLEGNSFGRKEKYSEEELAKLKEDIQRIYNDIMKDALLQEKIAVITAGAPGAGKTILMRFLLEQARQQGDHFAYVDPDDVCLKSMDLTWAEDIRQALKQIEDLPEPERLEQEKKIRQEAYNKWRPGSNAAAHLILANLICDNYAFYFGSTSSSPMTANTFKYLKELGYKIHLIHISAPDDVRWESIKERDKSFVQTTAEDTTEKGKLVPQRINDTYLAFADKIDFYYRDQTKSNATLAATWIRDENTEKKGVLEVCDQAAYAEMVKLHDAICTKLPESDLLLWENSVIKASKVK